MFTPLELRRITNDVAQSTLIGLMDTQAEYAGAWRDHLWQERTTAQRKMRRARGAVRAEWRKRLVALDRASILVGAVLTNAMNQVGKQVAAQLEAELKDEFASAVAAELRDLDPAFPEL